MVPSENMNNLPEINIHEKEPQTQDSQKLLPRDYVVVYKNVLLQAFLHSSAIFGIYLAFTSTKWSTLFFNYILFIIAGLGSTAGSHRLWAHKTFKAKLPLQIILMIFQSMAGQESVLHWCRDHRMHHKYADTDADPYNASRGFFYSHIGWLLVKKHPEVKEKGKKVPMDDLRNNPVLRFQKKYSVLIINSACIVLPTLIPIYYWNETLLNSWHTTILRYVANLNVIFLVNSIAHKFGSRPYDKSMLASTSLSASILSLGEGYHNYHHTFPSDYRSAELGNNALSLTTWFIDLCAWIGWAYDLKTIPQDIAIARANRTGDGTHSSGWADKENTKHDEDIANINDQRNDKEN